MKPTSRFRSALVLAISAILGVTPAVVLYGSRDGLARLQHLGAKTLVGMTLLRVFAFALFVAAGLVLLWRFVPGLTWRELAVVSGAGAVLGQIFPAGRAIVAKGVYLHRRHGLGYVPFAGVQTLTLLGVVAAASLTAAAEAVDHDGPRAASPQKP